MGVGLSCTYSRTVFDNVLILRPLALLDFPPCSGEAIQMTERCRAMTVRWGAYTLMVRWRDKHDDSTRASLKELCTRHFNPDSVILKHIPGSIVAQVKQVADSVPKDLVKHKEAMGGRTEAEASELGEEPPSKRARGGRGGRIGGRGRGRVAGRRGRSGAVTPD